MDGQALPLYSRLSGGTARRMAMHAGSFLCLAVLMILGLPLSARALQSAQNTRGDGDQPNFGLHEHQIQNPKDPQRHGGPDDYGYVFDDEVEPGGPVYNWLTGTVRIPDSDWQATRTISSTSTLDDGVMTTTLPFSFNYYGTPYTQLHISTNGNVHFGTPNDWYPEQSGACLPSSSEYVPRAMVAPLWYDLIVPAESSGGGGVYTALLGTAPNQIYLVEWRHVSKYNPPFGYATFEVLLYQTGEMYVQYRELTNSSLDGSEGVIGMHNSPGTIGLPYSCYTTSLIERRAIRYMVRAGGTSTPTRTATPMCGAAWGVVSSPNVGSGDNYLYGVAAVSADDVWAVGAAGSQALVEHWNGSQWSVVTGAPTPAGSILRGVDATSANDVWAVGDEGFADWIIHWDGVRWTQYSSFTPNSVKHLYGVTALSPNDAWVAGYHRDFNAYDEPEVRHWDGSSWTWQCCRVYYQDLYGVESLSGNNVWAVGAATISITRTDTLIEHWDGMTWSRIPSPSSGSLDALRGISAASANDIWAVGSSSDGVNPDVALIEHWDGISWSRVPAPDLSPLAGFLYGVKAVSPANVWAVGYTSDSVNQTDRALILHWDGHDWRVVPDPNPGTAGNRLYAVHARASHDTWAVGSYRTQTGISQTLTMRQTTGPLAFTDVRPMDYFYEAVRYLHCAGAISGYADGTFRPYNYTTRGQLAKIVTLAEAWPIYMPPAPTFRDVPESDPFYRYIETAYSHGVITGYNCGTACLEYRPGINVTRGQLCKIVALARGWTLYSPPTPTFRDVPTNDTFYPYIETAYSHGVVSGYGCGASCLEFHPGSNATRGQICKIVYIAATQP